MSFSRDYILRNEPLAKHVSGFNKRNSVTMLRQTPTGHVRTEIKWDNSPELDSAYDIAQSLNLTATFLLCIVYVEVEAGGSAIDFCSQVILSGRFQTAEDAEKWESLRDQLQVQEKLSQP